MTDMSHNRKKGQKKSQKKSATVALPPISPVSPASAHPETKRRPFLSFVHTNLGATLVGGILLLFLGLSIGYYQSMRSEERREREKRDAERVALTNEISPWLIQLWYTLIPFASPDIDQQSDSSLRANNEKLSKFGIVPETPVLAARVASAFGDSVRDEYLDIVYRNQGVEYAVRRAVDLRSLRPPTDEVRQAFKKRGTPLVEWNPEEERKLREDVPAKVDIIMKKAYDLGDRLRVTTFGPQPEIFR